MSIQLCKARLLRRCRGISYCVCSMVSVISLLAWPRKPSCASRKVPLSRRLMNSTAVKLSRSSTTSREVTMSRNVTANPRIPHDMSNPTVASHLQKVARGNASTIESPWYPS